MLDAAASTIMDWFASTSSASVPAPDATEHPILQAAAELADAADSDDAEICSAGIRALFAGVVEPLNDGFTPAGREVYGRVFGHVVWRCCAAHDDLRAALNDYGITSEAELLARYQRVRHVSRPVERRPKRIVILSRVTIGADVLLSTVLIQHLRACYPDAEIILYGDAKLSPLLGGFAGLRVVPLRYTRRGRLSERLRSWLALDRELRELSPDLVISPDSRIDQLGLLPLAEEEAYRLWENTIPDGEASSLTTLLANWCSDTFGAAPACEPQLWFDAATTRLRDQLHQAFGSQPLMAVKLDHGGNPAKALPREAEVQLLRELRTQGWRILIDRGFGEEELANSDALIAAARLSVEDIDDSGNGLGRPVAELDAGSLQDASVIRFHGSIAGWSAALAECAGAVSYDSVGNHLAAALGVPLVAICTGHVDDRFPVAWAPRGSGRIDQVVVPSAQRDDPQQWVRVWAATAAIHPH